MNQKRNSLFGVLPKSIVKIWKGRGNAGFKMCYGCSQFFSLAKNVLFHYIIYIRMSTNLSVNVFGDKNRDCGTFIPY